MSPIAAGRYRHYKGNEYTVLGVARHSETLEELVVYRQEYGDCALWVRPKSMFLELVEVNGQTVPRFRHLGADSADSPAAANLFADLPASFPQELAQAILARPSLRIERIVSHGHASPEGFWYDQDQHEFVVLLRGTARLQFVDRTLELTPGSYLDIPAHCRHRVAWTTPAEPTVWLAMHYGDPA